MVKARLLTWVVILLPMQLLLGQSNDKLRVALVLNTYTGDRASPEIQEGPEILAKGGIQALLEKIGARVDLSPAVKLTTASDRGAAFNRVRVPGRFSIPSRNAIGIVIAVSSSSPWGASMGRGGSSVRKGSAFS